MNSILELKNIFFQYAPLTPLLENISFSVSRGSWLSILGPNGCGKTTLLKIISRQLLPQQGTLYLDEKPYDTFSKEMLEIARAIDQLQHGAFLKQKA